MDPTLIAAAATFALVSSITPGPNNLLLASSGLAFGFRRTLPLLLGIETGFLLLLIAVALGLGALFQRFPLLHAGMKIAGAGYLLYLAWRLWRASGGGSAAPTTPLGFLRGALFQLVNPKAWMMITGAVGAYTLAGEQYWDSVAMLVLLFLVIGLPSIAAWAAFGAGFRRALAEPRTAMWVGRSMAVATAASCALILW